MNNVNPPKGSLAAHNLEEAGREMIIAKMYMRHKIEELAKKLVNLRHHGKKFNKLTESEQHALRVEAASILNSQNGGKRRTRRRKTCRKRRHTSLKRK